MFSRTLGIVAEGNVEIPVYWVQLLLPLGGLMMALVALEALARIAAGAPPLAAPRREPGERA
jgi:TRAP-type C4-dicarboxylate transport system permease small subunit